MPLGDIAEFRNGVNYDKSSFGRGLKVIGVKDFQDFVIPNYSDLEEINPQGVVTQGNLLRHGDIVFVRSNGNRELIGRSLFIDSPPEEVTHSGFTIRLRFTSIEAVPRFYAYLFRTPSVRKMLTARGGGTNISNLTQEILSQLEVPFPPLWFQKRIAAILSNYDDLIQINNARIQILVMMMRAIFTEWFVDYRILGDNTHLVDSSIGPVPGAWEIVTLDKVIAEIEAGSRPKGGIDPAIRDVPSIGAENILGLGLYDYSVEKYVSRRFFDEMKRGHVRSGDVLLYKDGAGIGRKSMFKDGFPHEECCVNEHVFILRTNGRVSQNYLYFWLDLPQMTGRIRKLNSNAAQPGINQEGVKSLPIILPTPDLIERFDIVIEPLLSQVFGLAKVNRILYQTRELLLPKIMSGGIEITNDAPLYPGNDA